MQKELFPDRRLEIQYWIKMKERSEDVKLKKLILKVI